MLQSNYPLVVSALCATLSSMLEKFQEETGVNISKITIKLLYKQNSTNKVDFIKALRKVYLTDEEKIKNDFLNWACNGIPFSDYQKIEAILAVKKISLRDAKTFADIIWHLEEINELSKFF